MRVLLKTTFTTKEKKEPMSNYTKTNLNSGDDASRLAARRVTTDTVEWSSIIVFKRRFPSLHPWYFFNRTNGPSFIQRSKLYTPHTPANTRSTSRTYGSIRRRQRALLTNTRSGNNRTSCIRRVISDSVSNVVLWKCS